MTICVKVSSKEIHFNQIRIYPDYIDNKILSSIRLQLILQINTETPLKILGISIIIFDLRVSNETFIISTFTIAFNFI